MDFQSPTPCISWSFRPAAASVVAPPIRNEFEETRAGLMPLAMASRRSSFGEVWRFQRPVKAGDVEERLSSNPSSLYRLVPDALDDAVCITREGFGEVVAEPGPGLIVLLCFCCAVSLRPRVHRGVYIPGRV